MPGKINACVFMCITNGTSDQAMKKRKENRKVKQNEEDVDCVCLKRIFFSFVSSNGCSKAAQSFWTCANWDSQWQCLYWDTFSLNSGTNNGQRDRRKLDLLTRWPQNELKGWKKSQKRGGGGVTLARRSCFTHRPEVPSSLHLRRPLHHSWAAGGWSGSPSASPCYYRPEDL